MGGILVRDGGRMLTRHANAPRLPDSLARRTLTAFLIAIAMMVAILPPALGAQRGPSRVPVTVAIPAEFEYGDARYLIVRDTTVRPSLILVLTTGATAADLSDAVRTLMVAPVPSSSHGTHAVVRVRPQPGGAQRSHPELPWAGRVLSDARRAAWQDLPGIGRARAVQIWLPLPRR